MEDRLDLVAHIREQIERDPGGYAEKRLPYVLDKIIQEVTDGTA